MRGETMSGEVVATPPRPSPRDPLPITPSDAQRARLIQQSLEVQAQRAQADALERQLLAQCELLVLGVVVPGELAGAALRLEEDGRILVTFPAERPDAP